MSRNVVFVLDIGSSKISVLCGGIGINDNLLIHGRSSVLYSGFSDGKFFEKEKLKEKITHVIKNVESSTKTSIKQITLAVPSEFCINKNKKVEIKFETQKRITLGFINRICASACEKLDRQTLIRINPISYILDNGQELAELEYEIKVSNFSCCFNAVYADSEFINMMNEILSSAGIQKVHYVCSLFCEIQYLISPMKINEEILFIDIGYLTTGIAIIKRKELLRLNSFSLGGGHIMGDLAQCLNLSIKQAECLKRKVVISINPSLSDYYEIEVDSPKKVLVSVANQVVMERLDMFALLISKCIKPCLKKRNIFTAFLTGGGISYIKGAKEYLSEKLGINLELVAPPQPQFNNPMLSSEISVLAYALKQSEKNRKGTLAKLLI